MKEVLLFLNDLVADGALGQYAIGGAIGASFYIEATNTEDVDVFAVLATSPGGLILIEELWAAARAKGAIVEGEYLRVGDWPVQILPAREGLVEDALTHSVPVDFAEVPTRVMTAEYLCAIAIQTGRLKDYYRVTSFIEQQKVNLDELKALLLKHDLYERVSKIANWPEGY